MNQIFADSERARFSKELLTQIEFEWENRVRSQVPASQVQTSPILRNTARPFVLHLFRIISLHDFRLAELEVQFFSRKHGEERSHWQGYFLPQLLKEFSLLREVFVEIMQNQAGLNSFERTLADKAIDTAMSLAAEEFSLQNSSRILDSLERAQSSNLQLSHFAAIAAHDLKSPLNVISGYANYLLEGETKSNEDSVDALRRIVQASERMRTLIDAILDYSKLESPQRNFQIASSKSLVQSAIDNLQNQINEVKGEVFVGELPWIECDPPLIGQLFQNLIANAAKFRSQDRLRIEITAEEDNDQGKEMVRFSVRDNGIGFPLEKREEIFELYKKLHSESKYQGSGIGLATCRRIVELHGGKIWAESALGKGATFYFTLPRGYHH